jgi:hypothetical protein
MPLAADAAATFPMSEFDDGAASPPISAALVAFGEQLKSCWDADAPESFWACEAPLGALIQSDFLTEIIESQLAAHLAFDSLPDIQCGDSSYAQLRLPGGLQLDVLFLEHGHVDKNLKSHPYNMLFGFRPLGDRCFVDVELFAYPGRYRNEIFDPETRLVPLGTSRLEGGSLQRAVAGTNAFRISAVQGPVMLVLLKSPPAMEFSWTYDRESLSATVGMVPQLHAYRLYYAARLLGQIPRRQSLESLLALSDHSAHFVRWTALQSLFRIDFDAGVERLKRATADEHPSVSRAAQRALQSITEG